MVAVAESLEQLPSPPGLQATIERDLEGTPEEPAQDEPAQDEEQHEDDAT